MAALPSYSDLQDQLAARAHQSPRFAELLRSPPALPRRVQSLRQWQTELERRSPSKAPLSPAGGLAELEKAGNRLLPPLFGQLLLLFAQRSAETLSRTSASSLTILQVGEGREHEHHT